MIDIICYASRGCDMRVDAGTEGGGNFVKKRIKERVCVRVWKQQQQDSLVI